MPFNSTLVESGSAGGGGGGGGGIAAARRRGSADMTAASFDLWVSKRWWETLRTRQYRSGVARRVCGASTRGERRQ